MTMSPGAAVEDPADRAFLGHPKGLGYLAFTEAFERYSYYAMQTLLVLYMAKQLLLPGHVDHVAGFAAFRSLLEGAYGHHLSTQALASAIFGLYTGAVYLTPLFGGLVADRLLGKTATIILGGLLMSAGHFLMAFDLTFLVALLCLAAGVGCFKGNIASQVGSLYGEGDNRRADAFQIFYLAINFGVIAAPLTAGTLGEKVAWHYGFGLAGIGMVVALCVYLTGRRHLPPEPVATRLPKAERPKLAGQDVRALGLLLALLPVLAVAACGNQQIFNAYLLWADANLDLNAFGHAIPTSWLITLDSVVSVSFLAGMVVFWRVWARRFPEPDELGKITIGALISVTGFLSLAAGAATQAATGHKVSLVWAVAFHVLNSAGFANIFPVSLALYARAAPKAMAATIIGIFYLHLFAANNLVGYLGGLLEKMPATQFWLMHAGLALASGLVFLAVKLRFGRWLLHEDVAPDAVPEPA